MNLEEVTIRSSSDAYSRTAWIAPGPTTAHALCLILDGEHYLHGMDALPVLDALAASGTLSPTTFLFLSHGGAEARHVDYVGSARFARFVSEDVVAWTRAHVPTISAGRDHLICGVSLSGLAAAHLAVTYPQVFSAALCQSGSFWWEPESFAALVRARAPASSRFWLSVGDQETDVNVSHPPTGMFQTLSQIEGVERARSVLVEAGADVRLHRFHGGHTFAPWRG
ncbi:MAG: alpha/beta hydrolase, partial [Dehalococcoidia bacterium]